MHYTLVRGASSLSQSSQGFKSPMHCTAVYGAAMSCRMLLDAGADINARDGVRQHLAQPSGGLVPFEAWHSR